jgi:hypothetical protein
MKCYGIMNICLSHRRPSQQMIDFREVLSQCDLHDIGYWGLPWTFNNKQAGDCNVRVRLDRVVASPSWVDWFPQVRVKHLISACSDHCPIFLNLEQEQNLHLRGKPLRCEVMWEREESLSGEIRQSWVQGETIQNLGDVAHKLTRVMRSLKRVWRNSERLRRR